MGFNLKRISLILLSIIFTLVLLEGFLRIFSFFYLKAHVIENEKNKDRAFNIVCIGDSFTMGVGAASGEDYPSQLEKILNLTNKKLRFRVINSGIPGCTTSMALNSLEGIILKYRPNMIIIMLGCNDTWNYTDLNLSSIQGESIPLSIKINALLFRFKTYKLLRIIAVNLKYKINEIANNVNIYWKTIVYNLNSGKLISANAQKAIKRKEDNYFQLANEYRKHQHKLGEALVYCEKVLEIDPMNTEAYCFIADVYREQGKFVEALLYSKKVLMMNSGDFNIRHSAYLLLLSLYYQQHKRDPDIERILENENKRYGNYSGPLKQKNSIEKIIFYNLNAIASTAKGINIKLVFSSYPEYITPQMYEISQKFGITFIDMRTVFKNLLVSERREAYFVPDNHCNAKGYRVMAEVIAERISNEPGL